MYAYFNFLFLLTYHIIYDSVPLDTLQRINKEVFEPSSAQYFKKSQNVPNLRILIK